MGLIKAYLIFCHLKGLYEIFSSARQKGGEIAAAFGRSILKIVQNTKNQEYSRNNFSLKTAISRRGMDRIYPNCFLNDHFCPVNSILQIMSHCHQSENHILFF